MIVDVPEDKNGEIIVYIFSDEKGSAVLCEQVIQY